MPAARPARRRVRLPAAHVQRKMPHLRGKHLLRTLAAKRLPEGLSRLPKKGFTAPIGSWLAGPYSDMFASDVLASGSPLEGIVDMTRLRTLFDEHRAGVRDYWYPLWASWVFARWTRSLAA